ncbi:hypothetical protein KAU08_12180 [bacterium]|nr:hypothetical protein [bacterium]
MNPRSILSAVLISLFALIGCSGKGPVDIAVVNIPDPKLEEAIRHQIDKPTVDLLPSDLARVTELRLISITNLEGIQNCVFIKTLSIHNSDGINLSPLQSLPYLLRLRITDCSDVNINPIGEILTLDELALEACEISDITPLAGLINLTGIILYRNELSDISPLRYITNLENVRLSSNYISNIEPLEGLTNIRILTLNNNHLVDIGPLKFLINLNVLDLTLNQITDLTALIENPGLGDGLYQTEFPDRIYLAFNPLSYYAVHEQIPILEARGVEVIAYPYPDFSD